MRKLKVAILGTGPSAAYSAMACDRYPAVTADIISNRAPSMFFPGSFWLRSNPSMIKLPMYTVHIWTVGTAEDYLIKQWGSVKEQWLTDTSFPIGSRQELVYSPYDLLESYWKTKDIHLAGLLSDTDVIRTIAKQYDWVFMTFSTAKSRQIMQPFIVRCPIVSYKTGVPIGHYCVYDGKIDDAVVRLSSLFGYTHTEYAHDYIPDVALIGDGQVTWVPDTTPDAPEWDPKDTPTDNVTLIGRFARWDRRMLSDEAFIITDEVLEKIL